LFNLLLQRPYESNVAVVSRITGEVKGYLKVMMSPIGISDVQSSTAAIPETTMTLSSGAGPFLVHVGQQLLVDVQILELGGLREKEYTQVHVQFNLSSFGNVALHMQG